MSLVGPRPALPAEVAQYSLSDRRRLLAHPGITCTWQVSGRSDIPFDRQVSLDVEFVLVLRPGDDDQDAQRGRGLWRGERAQPERTAVDQQPPAEAQELVAVVHVFPRQAIEGGGVGVVLDGCIRDFPHVKHLDLGLWIRGVTPNYHVQTNIFPHAVNVPVACGDVLVMPGERVKLLLKFEDYEGLYLYHCHNLEHEDQGMMRNFLVKA